MKFCKECNNTGICVWCQGAGKEGLASVCRSCNGFGLCLSCHGKKFELRQMHQKVNCKKYQNVITAPMISEDYVNSFEDINFIKNHRIRVRESLVAAK